MNEVINNLYKCYLEVNHMNIDVKVKNQIKREIFKAIQGLFELELYEVEEWKKESTTLKTT